MSEEKQYHEKFLKYVADIVKNKAYAGLPITLKEDGNYLWVAQAKSETGKKRIQWCINKARELGLIKNNTPYSGMYADVMLLIHPTKRKVCQICGREMSLYYHYPNVTFLKGLNAHFNSNFTTNDHISYIWDSLLKNGHAQKKIASYLIEKGNLKLNSTNTSKDDVIRSLELVCRKEGKKCLGPGAMSNFPDRFDGFHSYNRCCRSSEDKGRSKSNLKSYTQDRRAYEYLSDGNIHAANEFMGSSYFNGKSADHIGPISLGFIHDPRYLQPMSVADNSTKRDRLQIDDIEKIVRIEKATGIPAISWQSKYIWEYIKQNYKKHPEKVPSIYRNALKQNMSNYMFILGEILSVDNGEGFFEKMFLEPKYSSFNKSYEFDSHGKIICEKPRHITERCKDEKKRFKEIAITSVYDYTNKNNRNYKNDLTSIEQKELKTLCSKIASKCSFVECKQQMENLMTIIQIRILVTMV